MLPAGTMSRSRKTFPPTENPEHGSCRALESTNKFPPPPLITGVNFSMKPSRSRNATQRITSSHLLRRKLGAILWRSPVASLMDLHLRNRHHELSAPLTNESILLHDFIFQIPRQNQQ